MIRLEMKGFLRFQTRDKFSGKVTQDTGFFPNTLLTAGMNQMSQLSSWLTHCHVGTNNTAPLPTDTSLLGFHASTNTIVANETGQQSTAPYYGWRRITFRHNAGTVAANLSEAGIGWGAGVDSLISRALILDPILQSPTTITPLEDELLDVTYELRYYPPLVDIIGPQVTLQGIVYDTITRAANVTGGQWSVHIGTKIGQYSPNGDWWVAYDGDIGTILTNPSGLFESCDNGNQFDSAYSNNSFEQKVNCITGATGWNLGLGIRSIGISTTAGQYQTQFNAVGTGNRIPKTIALGMNMNWIINWGAKV